MRLSKLGAASHLLKLFSAAHSAGSSQRGGGGGIRRIPRLKETLKPRPALRHSFSAVRRTMAASSEGSSSSLRHGGTSDKNTLHHHAGMASGNDRAAPAVAKPVITNGSRRQTAPTLELRQRRHPLTQHRAQSHAHEVMVDAYIASIAAAGGRRSPCASGTNWTPRRSPPIAPLSLAQRAGIGSGVCSGEHPSRWLDSIKCFLSTFPVRRLFGVGAYCDALCGLSCAILRNGVWCRCARTRNPPGRIARNIA